MKTYQNKTTKSKDLSSRDKTKKLFFDALPNRFTRGEAIELAKTFNMAERTAGSFLKSCLVKYLQQSEYGVYKKDKLIFLIYLNK